MSNEEQAPHQPAYLSILGQAYYVMRRYKDNCMQAVKKDLHGLIDTLEDNEARAVLEFARWLRKAEEPTPEEQRAIARGRREIRRGDWVPWRNVKRTDV